MGTREVLLESGLSNVEPSRLGWRPLVLAAAFVVVAGALYAAAVDYAAARKAMVASLRHQAIRNERVLSAMSRVPRHEFVEPTYRARAYDETEIPIGRGQLLNSPFMTALMTQALDPRARAKVLTIGCGGGYQAAVLAQLTPDVYVVERQSAAMEAARRKLQALGYRSVRLTTGDGAKGWAAHAPYDAILVTVAVKGVPPPLVEQLADGGCLVAPIGGGPEQTLCRFHKSGDYLRSETVAPVRLSGTLNPSRGR